MQKLFKRIISTLTAIVVICCVRFACTGKN